MDFLSILIVVVVLAIVFFLFHLYIRLIHKIKINSIKRQIERGKLSDKKLMTQYQNTDKARKNTVVAIFLMGVFFKYYLNLNESAYQLYRTEMESRCLLSNKNEHETSA